jgi:fructokinase
METWVSGTALAADHARTTGEKLRSEAIVAAALAGEAGARATLDRHAHRLARGLATVVNLVDPHVVVLGGGLSALPHLYQVLPGLMAPYVFADVPAVEIRPPRWGDASGVRGAARLWSQPTFSSI